MTKHSQVLTDDEIIDIFVQSSFEANEGELSYEELHIEFMEDHRETALPFIRIIEQAVLENAAKRTQGELK